MVDYPQRMMDISGQPVRRSKKRILVIADEYSLALAGQLYSVHNLVTLTHPSNLTGALAGSVSLSVVR
jgi:hypothetical protein